MSTHTHRDDRTSRYKADSLTLAGAVAMDTGVMIDAGIFALTDQVAELAGEWFPFAFLAAAVVTAFSAYLYVKLSNAYPSAGDIAVFVDKAYGRSAMTGACASWYGWYSASTSTLFMGKNTEFLANRSGVGSISRYA